MIKVQSTGTLRATDEELALLCAALTKWTKPKEFTDAHVSRVKDIFRRAFSLAPGTLLVGSVLPDAIVLQRGGRSGFLALQLTADEGGSSSSSSWEMLEIAFTNEETLAWAPGVSLHTVLEMLEMSGALEVVNIGRA
jgi:hypothetical protein